MRLHERVIVGPKHDQAVQLIGRLQADAKRAEMPKHGVLLAPSVQKVGPK